MDTVLSLHHPDGLRLQLTDLGATWMSCRVPLPDGGSREVVLGYEQPAHYLAQPGYLGAMIGRYANRIAGARYAGAHGPVQLVANEGPNLLHGGPDGFDRRRWRVEQHDPTQALLTLQSADGDQGFPGAVVARVRYRLDTPLSLRIEFEAEATQPTALALTHHAYLNLDGADDPAADARGHRLRLAADRVLPVDAGLIPLGPLMPVANTDFDFRSARTVGERWLASEQQRRVGGYDHCFRLHDDCRDGGAAAAELHSRDGRVSARLFTDRAGLQFYSGQWLATTQRRGGGAYRACQGLALEPGAPPDAPNRPDWHDWSDCFAAPGRPWRAWMRWAFSTR